MAFRFGDGAVVRSDACYAAIKGALDSVWDTVGVRAGIAAEGAVGGCGNLGVNVAQYQFGDAFAGGFERGFCFGDGFVRGVIDTRQLQPVRLAGSGDAVDVVCIGDGFVEGGLCHVCRGDFRALLDEVAHTGLFKKFFAEFVLRAVLLLRQRFVNNGGDIAADFVFDGFAFLP